MIKGEKEEKLENIVKQLCEKQFFSESSINEILKNLNEIYEGFEKYRHKYSRITNVILNAKKDREQAYMILAQNIRSFEKFMEMDNNNIKNITQLEKLYDHINLECIRLRDYDNELSLVQKQTDEIKKEYKELKENLSRQQTNYITILGIFASIVLAFVGGLVFSTSVLANIDKSSMYRLIFIAAFIALFFSNILYHLFKFLSKIALVQDCQHYWYKKPIVWFNTIVVLFMIVGMGGEITTQHKLSADKTLQEPLKPQNDSQTLESKEFNQTPNNKQSAQTTGKQK